MWHGTYICPQGETLLDLRITSVQSNRIDAIFDFTFGDIRGSFALVGAFDPQQRRARFESGPWIVQPSPDWSPVGLDGTLTPEGTDFEGAITTAGCGGFHLRRIT